MSKILADRPVVSMNVGRFALSVAANRRLRREALRCVGLALRDFFGVQWRARVSPGLIPISQVDHPLDALVPFAPRYVGVYMDFIPFWIRTAAWLRGYYGPQADVKTAGFIRGIASLYSYASSVYYARLSTTRRPFYVRRPRFALIHLTDPHFACVPSLHVMIVVYAWLAFRQRVREAGDEAALAERVGELRAGALAITESILYVKQHSVNCISAALYVISILFPASLPEAEAEVFIDDLFREQPRPQGAEAEEVRVHVLGLYRRFLAEGRAAEDWRRPLLDFLVGLECRPGLVAATPLLLQRVPRQGDKAMEAGY